MAKNPSFQMYAADFLTDTQDWEAEEVGVYIRLLLSQWVNGRIPKDKKKIARVAGVSVDELSKVWATIGAKFVEDGSGNLINKRLEKSRTDKEAYLKKQSEKGKKSAQKRWNAEEKVTAVVTETQPESNRGHNSGYNSVTHSVITETKPLEEEDEVEEEIEIEAVDEENKGGNENLVLPFGDKVFEVAWKAWKEYKREQHNFEYKSLMTEQAALKELGDLSGYEVLKAVKIIYQSIGKGWKGLFKLSENEQPGTNKGATGRGATGGNVSTASALNAIDAYYAKNGTTNGGS